ncbi:MAG: TIGR03032 family protein [Planctomycetia bacterium]|nr:TIGR03032 family protein [Planctomycetia bacterium]
MIRNSSDEGFQQWMFQYGGSIALTLPTSGKVAFLGWDGRQITAFYRQFDYPTGMAVHGEQLLITSRQRITLYANNRQLSYDYDPQTPGVYDSCYLPRASWYVGEVYPRETAFDKQGMLFVNTRFSCLARPSFKYHFETAWKPEFVSEVVPEDRCHLSGVAIAENQAAYVTAFGATNTQEGWKENLLTSGVLINVPANQVVLRGLCMPHSPRWYKGCLWFLNSGAGELWVLSPRTNDVKVVCSLPGYVHGLDFWNDYAIIGVSLPRNGENNGENGRLPFMRKNQKPFCGVVVLNIHSGQIAGIFQFLQGCSEIFDLRLLPKSRRVALLTLDKPACHEAVTCDQASWWIRPKS